MSQILENLLVMVLTIVALVGGGYLLLMILHWGLKLKSRGREEEGLSELWQAAQLKQRPSKEQDDAEP